MATFYGCSLAISFSNDTYLERSKPLLPRPHYDKLCSFTGVVCLSASVRVRRKGGVELGGLSSRGSLSTASDRRKGGCRYHPEKVTDWRSVELELGRPPNLPNVIPRKGLKRCKNMQRNGTSIWSRDSSSIVTMSHNQYPTVLSLYYELMIRQVPELLSYTWNPSIQLRLIG